MFKSMIDKLDDGCWKEICSSDNCQEGWTDYHLMRNHKHKDKTTVVVVIAQEDGDPKTVELKNLKPDSDPLDGIGRAAIKLDAAEKEIIGINLDDMDIVVKK